MIPYGRHCIDDDDITAVIEVLRSDYLTSGPETERFEIALAEYTDARYAIACSSGTAALHLAAMALNLGPGQAAVVPAITFLATANAVRMTGAEVVFSDVDTETGLMRVEDIEDALKRGRKAGYEIRAILPVHLNGQCVDIENISAIAKHEGLSIITDASHAIGAEQYENGVLRPVGSGRLAQMTTFSFHPVKIIAMGEGGAITTDDYALAERLRKLRNHGMIRDPMQFVYRDQAFDGEDIVHPWYYELHEPGLNYRASDIHCALGRSQLGKLKRFVDIRKKLVNRYDELIASYAPLVRPVKKVTYGEPAWHLYPVFINFSEIGITRRNVMEFLNKEGISTQVHYLPVHRQPYYRQRYGHSVLGGADEYYRSVLSLPLFVKMTYETQDKICELLGTALKN